MHKNKSKQLYNGLMRSLLSSEISTNIYSILFTFVGSMAFDKFEHFKRNKICYREYFNILLSEVHCVNEKC